MKIILLKDVPKVGYKYETKTVKPGYGQNFLIKNKLAVIANPKNIANISSKKAKYENEMKAQEEILSKSIEGIESLDIKLVGKANEKGHLFAGIDERAIAEAISLQTNTKLDVRHIILDKHIKEIGEHDVVVKVGDREAKVKLTVEAE